MRVRVLAPVLALALALALVRVRAWEGVVLVLVRRAEQMALAWGALVLAWASLALALVLGRVQDLTQGRAAAPKFQPRFRVLMARSSPVRW